LKAERCWRLAADKGKVGEGYILGNEVISFKTLNRILVEETGCQPVKFFLPIELAERELGYTTRPLEVTLRDQIQWLKENGKI
jgi:dihydroflavonol-4-reductase